MKLMFLKLSQKASALALLWILVFFVYATETKGQDNEVLYRVNAGGAKVEDDPINWEVDQAGTSVYGTAKKGKSSSYLTLTNLKTEDLAFGVSALAKKNKTDYPDELFKTERFSTSRNRTSQTWDFPVSIEGTYTVNLLFAEIWDGATEPGTRVFGIAIEGNVVTEALDLTKEVGWNVPTVKTYEVEVTDGNLDINLLKNTQNPAIKGIEIIGPAGANINLPPRFATLPIVRAEAGETLEATFTTLEKDGDEVALEIIIKDHNGNEIDPSIYQFTDNGDGTGNLQWETNETDNFVYNATITASDKDGSVSKKFSITISEKVKNILFRVNAGGMMVEDASDPLRQPFAGDTQTAPSQYGQGGETYGTSNPVTVDPTVPAYVPLSLFQSERFQEEDMKWSFPVDAGTMANVRIYLSEIFLTEDGVNSNAKEGPRIFDIIINEDTVEKAVDVFEEVGSNVGIMRSYNVSSQGSIDIEFAFIAENPSVKGIEIIKIEPLLAYVSKNDAVCFDGYGLATIEVSGGIGPYEIIWGDGITPNQLLAGTYTATIKDASGQELKKEVTISQPEALSLTIDTENATIAGESDGKASATVTGGKSPYEYAWGEGVNPEALHAGNYTLTVTDANGCSVSDEFVIGDPEMLVVKVKTTNPSCFGDNGSAEVSISGGVTPYETVWKEDVDPTALPAGEYTVTVTDKAGKQVETEIKIKQPKSALTVDVNTTDASAFGVLDGSVSLEIAGGTSPYNIFWGEITPNALEAGTYNMSVKDAAGCEKEVEFTIGQPEKLIAEITTMDATCDIAGSATVTVEGGIFPYSISWNNQANPDSLVAGTYQVVITDANNVRIIKDVEIISDCEPPLATDDLEAENSQLKLYPVPGDQILNISVPATVVDKEGIIRIFNIHGQKLMEQKINTLNLNTINVSHLQNGTYILEVTTKNTVLKQRFLIK